MHVCNMYVCMYVCGVGVCSVPCSWRVAGSNPPQKPPRGDPGQVLHSQLLMRFGVKLRFSVRAVVGSASVWAIWKGRYNKCSNTIQYNTMYVCIFWTL